MKEFSREIMRVTNSDAAVAQWIEYWPPKPRVVGSIPASRTKLKFATLRGGVFVSVQWLPAAPKFTKANKAGMGCIPQKRKSQRPPVKEPKTKWMPRPMLATFSQVRAL